MARKNEKSDLATVIQVMEVTGALHGQRVCITGHMGLPRKEIQRIISQAGGQVHEDVHSDTTILVSNNDWTAQTLKDDGKGNKKSSKMIKAEQNNRWGSKTQIMSEDEFYQLIIDRGQVSGMKLDE